MTNSVISNQSSVDDIKIENETCKPSSKVNGIAKFLQYSQDTQLTSSGSNYGPQPQRHRLLGNRSAPTLVLPSNQISAPKLARRRSDNSLLGSLNRLRLSIAASSKDHSHVFSRYRQSRFNARRIRKRVVFKHGDCNVEHSNVAKRRRKYLQDIFTTLVDAQWRWTLLVFACGFLLSWLSFAIIWWLIVFTHGDLNEDMTETKCISGVKSFASVFLFSIETQHTIGYGSRYPTEECPEAIFIMCMQSLTGVMIQAFMVGVVFAKLSRPKKRTQTLLFSRHAVISHRDGIPCLMFRVGDMRKSHIIEAHVRAQLIKHKVTKEGESLPFFQTELKVSNKVGGDGEEDKIFFIWPTTIVHKIDKKSPLYNMSATDLLRERFEIVVILEGVIESTGMTTQARSSYLPSEILWGHRFQSLVSFKKDSGEYEVDYALFNNTIEVDTPLCSAKQLDEHRAIFSGEGLEHVRSGVPIFPSVRTHSSDSLSSLDSMFIDDGHIELKIPRNDSHGHFDHRMPRIDSQFTMPHIQEDDDCDYIEMKVPSSPINVTVTAPDEFAPLLVDNAREEYCEPETNIKDSGFYEKDITAPFINGDISRVNVKKISHNQSDDEESNKSYIEIKIADSSNSNQLVDNKPLLNGSAKISMNNNFSPV